MLKKWVFKLALLALALLIIVVICIGGGHGTYLPAMIFFPFGMLESLWHDVITWPFVVVALLQFPMYGLLIDYVVKSKGSKWIIISLAIVHFVIAVLLINYSYFRN